MNTLDTAKELLEKMESISFEDVLENKSDFFKDLMNWISKINTDNKEFEKITNEIQEDIGCLLKRIGAINALRQIDFTGEEKNNYLDKEYEEKITKHQRLIVENIKSIIHSLEQENFPRKVKCFIANSEVEIAIQMMLDYFELNDNMKAYNETILFSSSHKCMMNQMNRNTISFENMNLERNRINNALINLIDNEI